MLFLIQLPPSDSVTGTLSEFQSLISLCTDGNCAFADSSIKWLGAVCRHVIVDRLSLNEGWSAGREGGGGGGGLDIVSTVRCLSNRSAVMNGLFSECLQSFNITRTSWGSQV